MRNCAHMNSVTLRTGRIVSPIKVVLSSILSSLKILLQSFHWKLRLRPCPPWALHPWTTLCCFYLIHWCLLHRKICNASAHCLRLENSLKLVRCQGVQRREQNSWNLWCLSFRKCISTCLFLIWTGKAQFPYVWSFRSKIFVFVRIPPWIFVIARMNIFNFGSP